jgi:hypothetical protein
VAVRCSTLDELSRVKECIAREGFRLPDDYRVKHLPQGQIIDWSQHAWYSGGQADFDYLATFTGDVVDGVVPGAWGSRGDNRFFHVYEASEVLEPTQGRPA